jgi:four helix bundle protein
MREWESSKEFQTADGLAVTVYGLSARTPAEERFGLALQLRRAAAAVPLHLVEAFSRSAPREVAAALAQARTAAHAARYLLGLARRLGVLSGSACAMAEDRYLHLIQALERRPTGERERPAEAQT